MRVADDKDVAVDVARTRGAPPYFQVHTVFGINEADASAVHGAVGHGAQADNEAELVVSKGIRHVRAFAVCLA